MKQTRLLRTLLAAVCLFVGTSSAWGEVVEVASWTFTNLTSDTDVSTNSENSLTESDTECSLATTPSCCEGLYFQGNMKVYKKSDTNSGLRNIGGGDRMIIVPNLKKGDIITITGNSDAINNINNASSTGTKDEVKGTLTYTMSADGNFYFKLPRTVNTTYPAIKSIVVTHNYANVYKADFEDAETYTNGWTFSNISPSQGTNNDNKYLLLTQSKSGSASISFANNNVFSYVSVYRFSFNFNMNYHVGTRTTTVNVNAIKNGEKITLFKIVSKDNVTGYNGTSHVLNSSGEDLTTFANGGYGTSAVMTPTNSFVITSSPSGTTLSVNSGTPIVLSDGLVTINDIAIETGNSSALKESFDNITLSVEIDPYKTRATNAYSSYNAICNSVMNSTIKSALNSAKSSLDSFADDAAIAANVAGYISAVAALEIANAEAQTSADNFAILNNLIANANTFATTVTEYNAPENAENVYTSDADVDPIALATAIRNEISRAGVEHGNNTDISAMIANNSFEMGNTRGWTIVASDDTGARWVGEEGSTYYTSGADGNYLFNTWSKGTPVTQTIGTLPAGQYTLSCLISSNGATVFLKMNDNHNSGVTTSDGSAFIDDTYTFTLAEPTEVTIGAVGGNGTEYSEEGSWWYKADKFTLTYNGQDELAQAKAALEAEIESATTVKNNYTSKVGSAPFLYPIANYNTLTTEINEAQSVIDADGDVVSEYTNALTELQTAKDDMSAATQNAPDPNKYYRIYVADNDAASVYNLNLSKGSIDFVTVTTTPYPCKFTADGTTGRYFITDPYGNKLSQQSDNNSNVSTTYIDSDKRRGQSVRVTLNDNGTLTLAGHRGGSSFYSYSANTVEGSKLWVAGTTKYWVISDAVDVTEVNLSVNATAGWGTFIAPYDNLIPSTVKAYTVSYKKGNSVSLEENETGVLSANTPYILSTEASENVNTVFTGIANNSQDSYEVNGLVGLLTSGTVPANSYVLQYQAEADGTAFYKTTGEMNGTANRCYLNLANVNEQTAGARASISLMVFGDDVTGISHIRTREFEIDDSIYNVNGQRVSKPTNGLYIKNGKKFFVNKEK